MKKKILIGSIVTVFMLVCTGIIPAVFAKEPTNLKEEVNKIFADKVNDCSICPNDLLDGNTRCHLGCTILSLILFFFVLFPLGCLLGGLPEEALEAHFEAMEVCHDDCDKCS